MLHVECCNLLLATWYLVSGGHCDAGCVISHAKRRKGQAVVAGSSDHLKVLCNYTGVITGNLSTRQVHSASFFAPFLLLLFHDSEWLR